MKSAMIICPQIKRLKAGKLNLPGDDTMAFKNGSMILSCPGDTAKHIKTAFAAARDHGAALFFDEADSLLSKRVCRV